MTKKESDRLLVLIDKALSKKGCTLDEFSELGMLQAKFVFEYKTKKKNDRRKK